MFNKEVIRLNQRTILFLNKHKATQLFNSIYTYYTTYTKHKNGLRKLISINNQEKQISLLSAHVSNPKGTNLIEFLDRFRNM